MDPHKKDQPDNSDQINHSQQNPWVVDQNQEFEDKFMLVYSELEFLKKRMEILKHDLRGPLGGITGMIDLQLVEGKDLVEMKTSDLIMIKESAQSLLNLINGSLVTKDTQTNLWESVNIDKNLSSVITEINRLYLPMAQNKGVSLSLRGHIDTEIHLPANFFMNLIQITGNLISNAVKFTPSNGTVDVVFTLDADENHSTLKITVADTGKSMSPDQVSAFNQGQRVPRSTGTNGEQGFGIGLQHVLHMVSEYTGSIFVKSGKDTGTEFSLSVPLPDHFLNRMSGSHSVVKNGTGKPNSTQG